MDEEIYCPHCGCGHYAWDFVDDPTVMEADFDVICENEECGKVFKVEMTTTVKFTVK